MQTVYIVHSLYSVKSSFFQSSPFIVSQLLLLWTTSVVTKYPFNPRKDIFWNSESQQCLLQIILLLSFTFPERWKINQFLSGKVLLQLNMRSDRWHHLLIDTAVHVWSTDNPSKTKHWSVESWWLVSVQKESGQWNCAVTAPKKCL